MEEAGGARAWSWYLSREEIERGSPSRRDGVGAGKEAELRATYCSFIRDVGVRLTRSRITISTAIMLCHRFYLHQSHAKNEWQTVATVCIFLASKIEDTPCSLQRVVVTSYETMYRKNPDAALRIQQKEVLEQQKDLILLGEALLLSTIRFDFNIQHPYEPLKLALNNLGISQTEVKQVAMDLINDAFWTTLVLQFKPHYIAAGSLFLAAKFHNISLSSEKGKVWWHEFDVAPKQLQAVIQQMTELLMNRNPCSMDPTIKLQTRTPTQMEKQHVINTRDPAPRHTHFSKRSPNDHFDIEASRCMPTDSLANHIPTDKSARNDHQTLRICKDHILSGTPTPTQMEKHQIISTRDPVPRHTHFLKRSPKGHFDREASRCMPAYSSANHNPYARSARNGHQTLRTRKDDILSSTPTATQIEKQQIVTIRDPAPRHTHFLKRSPKGHFDSDAPRCMPAGSSANHNRTDKTSRNDHETLRPRKDHSSGSTTMMDVRLEKRSSQEATNVNRVHNVCSDAPRCMPAGSSANHNRTDKTSRNDHETLRPRKDHSSGSTAMMDVRLEKRSSQEATNVNRVHNVCSDAPRCMPAGSSANHNRTDKTSRNDHETLRPRKDHSLGSTAMMDVRLEKRSSQEDTNVNRVHNVCSDAPRCMPAGSSANHNRTNKTSRNDHETLRPRKDHSLGSTAMMDVRLEKRSSQEATNVNRVHNVCSGPKDINLARFKDLITYKRRTQDFAEHPSSIKKSDKGAWIGRELRSVIVVKTEQSSWKKQKL